MSQLMPESGLVRLPGLRFAESIVGKSQRRTHSQVFGNGDQTSSISHTHGYLVLKLCKASREGSVVILVLGKLVNCPEVIAFIVSHCADSL